MLRLKLCIIFVWLLSPNAVAQNIESPGGKLSLSFGLTGDGEPTYQLSFGGEAGRLEKQARR